MTELYKVAEAWMALGTVPIPLIYRSKKPRIRWQEYQSIKPSADELRSWFSIRYTNIAVITGWHGLTVLDFDNWQVFETWCQMFGMPDTYMVRTARGVHAYYLLDKPTRTRSLGKIDIKGRWGYVLVPPSIHPSGTKYTNLYKPQHIQRAGCIEDIVPAVMIPEEPLTYPPLEIGAVDPSDPWGAAANPRVFSGNGKVADVLARHRIEDLFPDKERTSADGRYYIARCPFHPDHNPSFWIDTKEQKGGCYTGCIDKSVDVINVYAQMHGISNQEALHVLAS